MKPTTGAVYVSSIHPDIRLRVHSITEAHGLSILEVIELDGNDDDTAPAVELTDDEWAIMADRLKLTASP